MDSRAAPTKSVARFFEKPTGIAAIMVAALCGVLALPTTARADVTCSYDGLTQITDFGDNPGNLHAYYFVPEGLPDNAPLVVALHGCGQKACDYDDETGWRALAQKLTFALLFPEQQGITLQVGNYAGNPGKCFSWWDLSQQRGFGEPKSIMSMTKWMVDTYRLDPQRIYVTGLSAGAGMTVAMLANHPDCFAGGAPIGGVPFNCAEGIIEHAIGMECMCMNGVPGYEQCARMEEPKPERTDDVWGQYVRDVTCGTFAVEGGEACPNTAQGGRWPRISIWGGTGDVMVAPINVDRLMKQWTNVHALDPSSGTYTQSLADPYVIKHMTHADNSGRVQVETYLIDSTAPSQQAQGTGHATPVDPEAQCGCASVDCACEERGVCNADNETGYIKDANVCSSRAIAAFWGLDLPATTGSASDRCSALQ